MKADQLSQTAAFIAVKFYGLTRDNRYSVLFDDSIIHFYEHVVKYLPVPLKYYHFWLKFRTIRSFYIWSEELLLPGDLMHIIARKWYIKQMADECIKDGCEQLIVLGAGFDHLAFHYAQQNIPCFEIDTPYMAHQKQKFIDKTFSCCKQPEIIPAHLPGDTLQNILIQNPQIDSNLKTIVIAEGFFDYLEADIVDTTLYALKNYFKEPTLISTHFALEELSKLHRWVFKSSVQLVREKLKFKTNISDFRNLLANHQLNVYKQLTSNHITTEFLKKIDSDLPVLAGFYLIKAK